MLQRLRVVRVMRRAARADDNQQAITAAFRARGATVFPTHTVGKGFPDLVIGYAGFTVLVEIKDPEKPPSKRRLTPDEQDFHDTWAGDAEVIETVDDVTRMLSELRFNSVVLARGSA